MSGCDRSVAQVGAEQAAADFTGRRSVVAGAAVGPEQQNTTDQRAGDVVASSRQLTVSRQSRHRVAAVSAAGLTAPVGHPPAQQTRFHCFLFSAHSRSYTTTLTGELLTDAAISTKTLKEN